MNGMTRFHGDAARRTLGRGISSKVICQPIQPRMSAVPLKVVNRRFFRWIVILWIVIWMRGDFVLLGESGPHRSQNLEDQPGDSQDLLLLGPLEPTRLRLRIEIEGVPFQKAWLDTFARLFRQFDIDGDGRITNEQAVQMASVFSARLVPESEPTIAPQSSTMMEKDSWTQELLQERFLQTAPPLRLNQKLSSGGAGPALVPLLDIDGDGRLSHEELSRAAQSLHCRDFNDDQLITEQELVAGLESIDSSSNSVFSQSNGTVILLTRQIDATTVAEILLARYDRNRDGVLSLRAPVEVQSEAGNLSTLDTDNDLTLNRSELQGYLNLPLDADLPFTLGGSGAKQKGTAAAGFRLRGKLDGGFRLQVGSREINFRRTGRNPKQDENRLRLQDSDTDKNGFLDATEYMNLPEKPDFSIVDSNRDGMISAMEFDSFFRQKSNATAVQILLDASEQGSDLFRSLDQNGDRVLTPRELLKAPELLRTDDQDRDGYLGGAEMAYNLVLELSRGSPRTPINSRPILPPKVKAERTGPTWFQKMDRNRDGDVGLPEFIGNRPTFIRLDVNGDGLLSADEVTSEKATNQR